MTPEDVANWAYVLSDPKRVEILQLIAAASAEGGITVKELSAQVDLSQPTVSYRLRLLRHVDMVETTKVGVWAYQRVIAGGTHDLADVIRGLS